MVKRPASFAGAPLRYNSLAGVSVALLWFMIASLKQVLAFLESTAVPLNAVLLRSLGLTGGAVSYTAPLLASFPCVHS